MKIEQELRSALQKRTSDWEAPTEVLRNVTEQIEAEQAAGGSGHAVRRHRPVRKRVLVGILSAVLILPTGAYAGYHYLSDSVYGSKANFGGDANAYEQLEAKLQTVKSQMSDSEYEQLTRLLREAASLYSQYAGEDGQLKKSEMSVEELARLDTLEQEIKKQTTGLDTSKAASTQFDENFTVEDFWAEVLAKAEKQLDSTDYAKFRALVETVKSDVEAADKTTMEQLNSYLLPLGYKVEQSN